MLTGDSYRTASTVANRLGVDAFCAEVLPADKAKFVADLRQKGHIVLMVGDGINDSPALSEADAELPSVTAQQLPEKLLILPLRRTAFGSLLSCVVLQWL